MQGALFSVPTASPAAPDAVEYEWFKVSIHNVLGPQTISVRKGTKLSEYYALCAEVGARHHVPERNILSVTRIPRP